jgi:hypothetical protein
VAADEGYFAVGEIAALHECRIRTVISEPHRRRHSAKAPLELKATLRRARRAVSSQSGKALLQRRGEHLERGFCHVLDHGGLRRATLRGCERLTKRHLIGAMSCKLDSRMRKLIAVGTPKQALAGASALIAALSAFISRWLASLAGILMHKIQFIRCHAQFPHPALPHYVADQTHGFSTGC